MLNFANFTNLYSLSKTLRFELKPIWATQKLLDENYWDLFRKDKIRQEIYENILKPKLEEIDRQFIQESLSSFDKKDLFPEELIELYKNDRKAFDKQIKNIAKEISKHIKSYSFYGNKWLKNILDEKKSVEVIKLLFGNEIYKSENFEELNWQTIKNILDNYFKWFTTYLTTFNQNRSNFYKDDLKFGRVATRILKDNLPKFIENISRYEKIKNTVNLTDEEKQIFDISNFINYLNQAWIDTYNKIIWNINSKINEYNQKHNLKWKNKLPKLETLYKQILWQSQTEDIFSFVSDIIDSDEKLLVKLQEFIENENKIFDENIKAILENFDNFDLEWIWIKKANLKKLSNKYLSNWSVLDDLLPKTDKEWNEDKKSLEEVVNLQQIKQALNNTNDDIFKEWQNVVWEDNFSKFIKLFLEDLNNLNTKKQDLIKKLKEEVFNKTFEKTSQQKQLIKEYLDTIKEIYQLVNNFSLWKWQGEEKQLIEVEKDTDFYEKIEKYLELEQFKFYNAVRNYLTKKPYLIEKLRIYFDNSTLLDGWDKNKEKDNFWIILRKYNQEKQDWDYFLLIMKKWFHNIFDNKDLYEIEGDYFEKMEYKLLPWPNKMLPKVFFSASRINEFAPSPEVLKIRERESFKQGENFNIQDLHTWIDFMKQSLAKHPEWKEFNFKFKDTKEYENIQDFYKDVEKQWYKLNFVKIYYNKLMKLIDEEKAYLFQIWNKDFSKFSKWKENLHTIYWKALFEEENFNQEYSPVYKLNWKAEIFFRPKSNIEVKERKLKDGKKIIEHKRYLQNKIFFHVPITLNFVNKWVNPKSNEINEMIKEYIQQNNIKIIWIDRWEKHLLYVVMIDENWNILEKKSLNCIINQLPSGEEKEVCYIEKLVWKEKSRDEERKSWDEIETIKELKEWYISQVVSYLVRLAVENNAIIVLEDLNSWFKRSRQKIERQIYQKFETALAKKLNYVIFKNKSSNEIGWKYKALQLAHLVNQYQDIRNQTWILFFTQAAYTSTTCPVCGFRKNIYPKFENILKTLEFIKSLSFYKENDYYVFEYEIQPRKDNKWNISSKTKFKITTKNQERIRIFRSKDNKKIEKQVYDMTEFFDKLFKKYGINGNLRENILFLWKNLPQEFFKSFIFGLNLLLQLRNSDSQENLDYIQCPRCSFDSREWFQWLDWDGDANGAYNIARRWKILVDKIKRWENKLWVSLVEWDNEVIKEN